MKSKTAKTIKVLVTGGTGLLGTHLQLSKPENVDLTATVHQYRDVLDRDDVHFVDLDIRDVDQVKQVVDRVQPQFIIHTAAHGRVDFCENNPEEAEKTNLEGTQHLVDAAKEVGATIVFCSTNMTFDGLKPPYSEKSPQIPGTVYGKTKVEAEKYIRESGVNYVIFRLMTMYGNNWQPERKNMISMAIGKLSKKEPLWMTNDVFNNMLYVGQAAETFWKVVLDDQLNQDATYNIAGKECLNRYDTTIKVCQVYNLDENLVTEVGSEYFLGQETPRSPNTCFDTSFATKTFGYKPLALVDGLEQMKKNTLPTIKKTV